MKDSLWKIRGGRLFEPAPFGIMGIVNVSPDSFYDGGKYVRTETARQHAHQLWQEGAHILDLGAESSRPGAKALEPKEEWQRLAPLIDILMHDVLAPMPHLPPAPFISVDTYHAATAQAALDMGVHIINDISACIFEPKLLEIIADYKPGYVLMHSLGKPKTMQNNPHYNNVIDTVVHFFEEHMCRLVKAGLPEEHIVLDVGIGFGKNLAHNLCLLQNISRIQSLGRPLLLGFSMKSLWWQLLGLEATAKKQYAKQTEQHIVYTDNRVNNKEYKEYCEKALQDATQTGTALMAHAGVRIHRVHNVARTVNTLHIAESLLTSP